MSQAKERPILFSAPMVRAILAGTKTQTRRAVKPQPRRVDGGVPFGDAPAWAHAEPGSMMMRCPYGKRGDRLWVRETFARIDGQTQPWIETDYRATYKHGDRLGDTLGIKKRWTPAIHMPRHASRITLEVIGVRVERLQDISEADCIAEGIEPYRGPLRWVRYMDAITGEAIHSSARDAFFSLWESINGRGSWDANPWLWAIGFTPFKGASHA